LKRAKERREESSEVDADEAETRRVERGEAGEGGIRRVEEVEKSRNGLERFKWARQGIVGEAGVKRASRDDAGIEYPTSCNTANLK
jgi:hypothetical protein